jgi:hypothetical protein
LARWVRSNPGVLVCRLVGGKVTYVHRRLWPAVVRLASTLGASRLTAICEVHTDSGAHRVYHTPLRNWVSARVRAQAAKLTLTEARGQLGTMMISMGRQSVAPAQANGRRHSTITEATRSGCGERRFRLRHGRGWWKHGCRLSV